MQKSKYPRTSKAILEKFILSDIKILKNHNRQYGFDAEIDKQKTQKHSQIICETLVCRIYKLKLTFILY